MKRYQPTYISLLIGLIILLTSCNDNRVYESSHTLDQALWPADTILLFSTVISDTVSTYSMYLDIRHDLHYPFSNLYLFFETRFPNGLITRDTIECLLAEYDGKWLGSGIGDIRANHFLFQQGIRFPLPGPYLFSVEQAMRTETLKGIRDIGIRIDKNK